MRHRSRLTAPLTATLVVLGMVATGLVAPTPVQAAPQPPREASPPVLASNGYVETATTIYTVNPARARLDVTIDIDFENTKAPTATTVYSFPAIYVWLEHGATNIAVTTSNGGASINLDRRTRGFDRYIVRFGIAIQYGDERHVRVTYQLPSGAPRSKSDVRIGKALAEFCVVGQGDDGGSIKVVIQSAFDVTTTAGGGGTLNPPSSGTGGAARGTVTWSTGRIGKPYDFWTCLSGTNEAGYTTTSLGTMSGREIELQSWPEDRAWKTEVKDEIDDILADLEALVGRGLPGHGPIIVREVAGGELGPYAGFFDPLTGVARIGENLGQGDILAHELSHTWFNDSFFFDRWVSEGFAEWARVSVFPDTCPAPAAYPGDGSPEIDVWQFVGPRDPQSQVDVVQYEYDAACHVITTLASKIGPDRMRTVLTALLDHQLAYRSGGEIVARPQIQATWRHLLDAFDELGLVPAGEPDLDFAQNLLLTYGIGDEDRGALADRSKARAAYHALADELGDWAMPDAIMASMAQWGFGTALDGIEKGVAIRASVAHADAMLPGIDAANGPIKDPFETAESVADLEAAAVRAADQATAADLVAAAQARVAAPRDALAELGLVGADLAGPLAAATAAAKAADLPGTQASAATLNALLDGASQQGLIRVAIAAALLVVVLLLAFLARRRRRAT